MQKAGSELSFTEDSPVVSPVPTSPTPVATADKIIVLLKATGNAPSLKQTKFKIGLHQRFQMVMDFLGRQLRLKETDTLFLYVNSAFSPAPDTTIQHLVNCFGVDGQLVVNYALTQAYG